eukprot:gene8899-16526_t
MSELLFTMQPQELKEVLDRYKKKTPELLNRQFKERVGKTEAVSKFLARKKLTTEYYPPVEEQEQLLKARKRAVEAGSLMASEKKRKKVQKVQEAHERPHTSILQGTC